MYAYLARLPLQLAGSYECGCVDAFQERLRGRVALRCVASVSLHRMWRCVDSTRGPRGALQHRESSRGRAMVYFDTAGIQGPLSR